MTDLLAMQRSVQRDWTPESHWHIGDLAWQSPSLADRRVTVSGDSWAWVSSSGEMEMHARTPQTARELLAWADPESVTAMEDDALSRDVVTAAGYRRDERPFFRHCLRDLGDVPPPGLPAGYRVRALRPGETERRVAVHRAAWRPKWLGRLQVPPADLGDGESSMTTARYKSIMGAWPYRLDLDLVVEAPDGTFAASALGWYDEVNRVGLLEPVGTDPRHARRGLGAAVSLACLAAFRDAGATRAVVCPRGDAAYPVPRLLYHSIGFRDAGRTVTYTR